jgi:hypothetical protein
MAMYQKAVIFILTTMRTLNIPLILVYMRSEKFPPLPVFSTTFSFLFLHRYHTLNSEVA